MLMIQRMRQFGASTSNHSNLTHLRMKTGWTHNNPVSVNSNSHDLSITVGKLARLANGSAIAKSGDTSVLVTVASESGSPDTGQASGVVPVTVDYRDKAAAAGKIPLNFLRRELGQTQNEILKARMIDRSLRPLFPKNLTMETRIVCNLLSFDRQNPPDVLAINAASAALTVSSLPWNGPIGAVRLGCLAGGNILVNPTKGIMENSILDLVLAADCQQQIVMLEGGAKEITSKQLMQALKVGAEAAADVGRMISQLQKYKTLDNDEIDPEPTYDSRLEDIKTLLNTNVAALIEAVYKDMSLDKLVRDNKIAAIRKRFLASTKSNLAQQLKSDVGAYALLQQASAAYDELARNCIRNMALEGIRVDGRKAYDLRKIECEIDPHPPLHGSAIFQRGQTQVLSTITLDNIESMKQQDAVSEILVGRSEKNFMLHYEFPQYATGSVSVKSAGGPNRREIGHGALAERAVRPVIPETFPFTIRASCEVLESSGSSSMASVCATSLALLDAGVPISTPVAGVAMGLVTQQDAEGSVTKYKVLSDIMGLEDYAGDMDMKIAGTKRGTTAIQTDIKISGLPLHVVRDGVLQGIARINTILQLMDNTLSKPRTDRKESWPATVNMQIPAHRRAKVIGVGGSNLKRIERETGVRITSESDTNFTIFAPSQSSLERAKELVTQTLNEVAPIELEFGSVYTGQVIELQSSGMLVDIHPGMDPIRVPNSQIDLARIHHSLASGLQVGDEVQLKYFGEDPRTGAERWSRKALLSTGGLLKRYVDRDVNQPSVAESLNVWSDKS